MYISSDCMDVEVNSPDETEDEITSSYEFLPPLKRFKCEDINSKEYLKKVKRIIFIIWIHMVLVVS